MFFGSLNEAESLSFFVDFDNIFTCYYRITVPVHIGPHATCDSRSVIETQIVLTCREMPFGKEVYNIQDYVKKFRQVWGLKITFWVITHYLPRNFLSQIFEFFLNFVQNPPKMSP